MRVENSLNRATGVSYSDIKKVNRDSALGKQDTIERNEEAFDMLTNKSNVDIASRNVTAKNAEDEVTKYQIAQGGLRKQNKVLNQIKETLNSFNGDDFNMLNDEVKSLISEIDSISDKTTYKGQKLFEGGDSNNTKFQVPSVNLGGKNYLPLHDLDIASHADLTNALATIDKAIAKVSNEITECSNSIFEMTEKVEKSEEFSYIDASVAREIMKSLKSEIYNKGLEAIEAQNVQSNKSATVLS